MKLPPDFCCYPLETKKVFQDSSFFSDRTFSVVIFSYVLQGGEGEIVVIEDLLAVLFGFFITYLPCQVVTFQRAVRI